MKEASSNLSEDTGNFGGVIDSRWPWDPKSTQEGPVPITDEIETLATSDETTEDSPLPSLLRSRKNISQKGNHRNMFLNGKYKESTKKVPLGQGSHLMKEASSKLSEDTGHFGSSEIIIDHHWTLPGIIDSPWPLPITDVKN